MLARLSPRAANPPAVPTMITLIEALNYRCLRYVSRSLDSFHVLVGPNASGKSTFLDVVAFLQDVISDGLDDALENRASNPEELLYRRQGKGFELAVEARIPEDIRRRTAREELDTARYEVAIGFDETRRRFEFKSETFRLKQAGIVEPQEPLLFPMPPPPPQSLLTPRGRRQERRVISKVPGGNDNFYSEIHTSAGKGWFPSFKLGAHRSALGNLPADEKAFPVATWFQELLNTGIQRFVLNSLEIKRPSPPQRVKGVFAGWLQSALGGRPPEGTGSGTLPLLDLSSSDCPWRPQRRHDRGTTRRQTLHHGLPI